MDKPFRITLATVVRAVPQRLRADETVSVTTFALAYAAQRTEKAVGRG